MPSNKGVALFIAIALLFLLSVGAILVLLNAYNYTYVTENQINRIKALKSAESGINYAYWKLRTEPGFTDADITVNGNKVDITVTGPVNGRYTVKSKVTY